MNSKINLYMELRANEQWRRWIEMDGAIACCCGAVLCEWVATDRLLVAGCQNGSSDGRSLDNTGYHCHQRSGSSFTK
jgi:hypothetical protein